MKQMISPHTVPFLLFCSRSHIRLPERRNGTVWGEIICFICYLAPPNFLPAPDKNEFRPARGVVFRSTALRSEFYTALIMHAVVKFPQSYLYTSPMFRLTARTFPTKSLLSQGWRFDSAADNMYVFWIRDLRRNSSAREDWRLNYTIQIVHYREV